MKQQDNKPAQPLEEERWALLEQIDALIDKPMIALSFVWLGLLILDLTQGLSPLLQTISDIIWALFIINFAIEVIIAPRKLDYLRHNWLTAISLFLPALRLFRIFRAIRLLRAARAVRSVSLLRVVTSFNRSMGAIRRSIGRRGVGYVIALTAIVIFTGAAGMFAFENPTALRQEGLEGTGLEGYGEAVWWTAMIMTTIGSEYWPKTAEGRLLGWLLSLYALGVLGYITGTIASFFVGQETSAAPEPTTERGAQEDVAGLQAELRALRAQLVTLTTQLEARGE